MSLIRFCLLTCLLSLGWQSTQAQLSIEISSGAELGWWVQNKGFNDTLPNFHQGYDRSHLSFMLPAELSLSYQYGDWRFGLGGAYRYFDDNVLVGTDNARGNYSRYRLQSENQGVRFWSWQAEIQYLLIQKPKFSFSPFLAFGSFMTNATIPEALLSTIPWHYRFGLELSHILGPHFQWYAKPRYARFHIGYEDAAYRDFQQNVYSIGILTGIRYRL